MRAIVEVSTGVAELLRNEGLILVPPPELLFGIQVGENLEVPVGIFSGYEASRANGWSTINLTKAIVLPCGNYQLLHRGGIQMVTYRGYEGKLYVGDARAEEFLVIGREEGNQYGWWVHH